MRTTITIPDDLLQEVLKESSKSGYSEAVVSSLRDYIALKKRLHLLESLYEHKLPHSYAHIKKQRQSKKWS
jgi:Arc/MetJ family transcription regulator